MIDTILGIFLMCMYACPSMSLCVPCVYRCWQSSARVLWPWELALYAAVSHLMRYWESNSGLLKVQLAL